MGSNARDCSKHHKYFYTGAFCFGIFMIYLACKAKINFGNFGFFGIGSIVLGSILIIGSILGFIYFSNFTTERKGVLAE